MRKSGTVPSAAHPQTTACGTMSLACWHAGVILSLPPLVPCPLQYDMMADLRNMSVAGGSAPAEPPASTPAEEPSSASAAAGAASQQDEVVGTGEGRGGMAREGRR